MAPSKNIIIDSRQSTQSYTCESIFFLIFYFRVFQMMETNFFCYNHSKIKLPDSNFWKLVLVCEKGIMITACHFFPAFCVLIKRFILLRHFSVKLFPNSWLALVHAFRFVRPSRNRRRVPVACRWLAPVDKKAD